MNGVIDVDSDDSAFVEVDPTGRYGRYNEILGKGASKTVYKAFDEYEGIEVAWNQVKLNDFLQSQEDLERLYSEIHLLKTLNHQNIMKFCTSWVDTGNRNINFVTELFTSGTLRQYRMKHRRVNIRAIKHWCRQILQGLLYLHSHDPPVIHRDLKCDNIFINGNQGEVKIGDLGLAAILRKSQADCVGTPEFMAPEVYGEEYNELIDIYSFGMCVLEMVTFEYPYSECTNPVQIYRKVTSGKKPDALHNVEDPEVRRFVEKCLATVSDRLSAWELLNDPFLQIDDYVYDSLPVNCQRDYDEISPILSQHPSSAYLSYDVDHHTGEHEADEIALFTTQDDEHFENNVDITIKGRRREDDIFLRFRIADKEGHFRNIYFPFDIETDTALSVANEMVSDLEFTDQDVTKIAEMIDGEIASLVPGWKSIDNGSDGSIAGKNLQVLQCKQGCGAIHCRFEEITYQFEESEQCLTDGAPVGSSQSDGVLFTDIWAQHERPNVSSRIDGDNRLLDELEKLHHDEVERVVRNNKEDSSSSTIRSPLAMDYENDIRQELRWLKAKYQTQMRKHRDRPRSKNDEFRTRSMSSGKNVIHDYESVYSSFSVANADGSKSSCRGALPRSLHRATSLPVDATDL